MDPLPDCINVAKEHLPPHLKGKVIHICDTVESYVKNNPSSEQFDTVIMSEIIEHVEHPEHFLKCGISLAKVSYLSINLPH